MASVTVRAPAKVNLQLAVGPLGRDGYHDLATIFCAVALYDEVTAAPAHALTVETYDATKGAAMEEVPTDATNLAVRAALALADWAGIEPHVDLTIRKRIPVAGGMAGGSANAAAALIACDALWGTECPRGELAEIAATLGADVPFALLGGVAMGLGRGEHLTPVLVRGEFHWVFAIANEGLSTPAVYAECDRLRAAGRVPLPTPRRSADQGVLAALSGGDPRALGAALSNDLQDATLSLRPELTATLDGGLAQGALGAIICGSGPTVGFLVTDSAAGLDLAVALTAMGLCRDVRRASGPVAGARIVLDVPR
ncbi:MAG: 4-(cytidine 5'-diphospho)-2-C-methyl-D-erythritol kinase [Sporichthyaceae bacterium]